MFPIPARVSVQPAKAGPTLNISSRGTSVPGIGDAGERMAEKPNGTVRQPGRSPRQEVTSTRGWRDNTRKWHYLRSSGGSWGHSRFILHQLELQEWGQKCSSSSPSPTSHWPLLVPDRKEPIDPDPRKHSLQGSVTLPHP